MKGIKMDTSHLNEAEYAGLFEKPSWKTRFRVRRLLCQILRHKPMIEDGFLSCERCFQSLTPEGQALGYKNA